MGLLCVSILGPIAKEGPIEFEWRVATREPDMTVVFGFMFLGEAMGLFARQQLAAYASALWLSVHVGLGRVWAERSMQRFELASGFTHGGSFSQFSDLVNSKHRYPLSTNMAPDRGSLQGI